MNQNEKGRGLTIVIAGTQATVTFPNTYGPGLHVVEFSLTDGDNDRPGDGAVGIFTCTFQTGPDYIFHFPSKIIIPRF